jgi:uncharacterized membrane protein
MPCFALFNSTFRCLVHQSSSGHSNAPPLENDWNPLCWLNQLQAGYQQSPPGYHPGYQPPYGLAPVTDQPGSSSLGIRPNVAAAISYFWIIGLVFFITQRKSRFVRFHVLQGLLWGAPNWILSSAFWYPIGLHSLGGLFSLIWLIVGIVAAVRAYRGCWNRISVIGDIAYKNAFSWNPPGDIPPGNPSYSSKKGSATTANSISRTGPSLSGSGPSNRRRPAWLFSNRRLRTRLRPTNMAPQREAKGHFIGAVQMKCLQSVHISVARRSEQEPGGN